MAAQKNGGTQLTGVHHNRLRPAQLQGFSFLKSYPEVCTSSVRITKSSQGHPPRSNLGLGGNCSRMGHYDSEFWPSVVAQAHPQSSCWQSMCPSTDLAEIARLHRMAQTSPFFQRTMTRLTPINRVAFITKGTHFRYCYFSQQLIQAHMRFQQV